MRAASANNGENRALLIASGADAQRRTSGGMTAVMVAAFGASRAAARA